MFNCTNSFITENSQVSVELQCSCTVYIQYMYSFYHNEFLSVQLNLTHLLRGGGVHLTLHLHRLPIRHKHGLHGQTSCDAYIPSHIGKTFDLMQSCLIQLTSKYINNMAILCSASWQCFIMLQGRWSPKLITCTKRPLKTDWKCGITILRHFL